MQGIRHITPMDMQYARRLGCKIKLLARIERNFETRTLSVSVHPTLLPFSNTITHVDDAYNGVCLIGDVVGTVTLIGKGAGPDATASAVISDIADAILYRLGDRHARLITPTSPDCKWQLARPEQIQGRYYVRLTVRDQTGVLAKIAHLFSKHNVSIATLLQSQGAHCGEATVTITTHESNEKAMGQTLEALQRLKSIATPVTLLHLF